VLTSTATCDEWEVRKQQHARTRTHAHARTQPVQCKVQCVRLTRSTRWCLRCWGSCRSRQRRSLLGQRRKPPEGEEVSWGT
jgi:hypothetical protein